MEKDDKIGGSEMRVCPITKGECNDQCKLRVKLADYEGCVLQLAETGLKLAFSELAQAADRLLGLKGKKK
jgi:hypothetical protein